MSSIPAVQPNVISLSKAKVIVPEQNYVVKEAYYFRRFFTGSIQHAIPAPYKAKTLSVRHGKTCRTLACYMYIDIFKDLTRITPLHPFYSFDTRTGHAATAIYRSVLRHSRCSIIGDYCGQVWIGFDTSKYPLACERHKESAPSGTRIANAAENVLLCTLRPCFKATFVSTSFFLGPPNFISFLTVCVDI